MFRARPAILNALAAFYGFIAFLLTLLILIAGSKSSILPGFYFLRTDASDLNVPAALSDSSVLRDVSSVSGVDLVGQDATARTLGLADTYTVSLLSSCGQYPGDKVECTGPEVGYAFDPEDDLKLSSTNILSGSSLFSYENVSRFMAAAYILSCIFVVIAPITAFLATRFPRAATLGAALASIATIFLAAASIAAVVVFPKVKDSFNDALAGKGIQTSVGTKLFVLSWLATVFALLVVFTLFARARSAKSNNLSAVKAHSTKGFAEYHNGEFQPTRGLLSGQESAKFSKLSSGPGSDDGMEMDPIRPRWRGETGQGAGRKQDQDSAYEPYSHAA